MLLLVFCVVAALGHSNADEEPDEESEPQDFVSKIRAAQRELASAKAKMKEAVDAEDYATAAEHQARMADAC